ncbi:MAG: YfhO family protein [Acidobacteria bacterium]|nr:YfhO family protein [Acidobacteriota bacterium]
MAPGDSRGRWATVILLILVLVPTSFNAIALFPEVSLPVPSLNDDAFHFLLVQRASEALAGGENPFDHWGPELDLGFPWFLYYQHLPHLTVVLLHRLLLKRVELLTLFNVVRYLLLIGFPLTVYWAMRRLGFSVVAGAAAAATATLLSSNHRYGFEYESYIWRGWGMYTQLWAMHLSFIVLACLRRLLERGTGYAATVVASCLLALSHLAYSYMMAPAALGLFLIGLNRANVRPRMARLAITAALTAVITSYFWLPFLLLKAHLGVSPYEPSWKYDSFGAGKILTWLVNGDLLDYGRLPVLTLLLALGVASALATRTRPSRLTLILLIFWLALFFGRHTWGRLADLLPLHERLHFHRFIGGVHLAAILLIGLGGEWLWQQSALLPERWRAVAAGLGLVILMVPALRERQKIYSLNAQWMEQTKKALDADEDARAILSALRELPPGRTSAGRRDNWGKRVKLGDLHFFDLLTFHRIVAISPYESFSLNADLIWHLDDRNPTHYNLFNVKYVVAPRALPMPAFLIPVKETARYTLYRAETSGYAQFAAVTALKRVGSQSNLFVRNRDWLSRDDPAAGRFTRWEYPVAGGEPTAPSNEAATRAATVRAGCPGGGGIHEEKVRPGRFDLRATCPEASTLVLKVTYHPNWRVAIDGEQAQPSMVSPSFIGLDVPPGLHQIHAEYRSPPFKTALLLLGACTLLATIWFRRRLARLDATLSGS